jgi:hypothetical protein
MPVVVNVAVRPVSPSATALPTFIGWSTALPLAAAGPHPQEEVGRSLVARIDRGLTGRRGEEGLPRGRHVGADLDRIAGRIEAVENAQQQALRFGRLLAIVQQRAPAQQLDRHAGERPAELVARQREKHDLARIAVGVVGHLHAVERRRIVAAPDEAAGLRDHDAERLVARAEKSFLRGRAAQILERIELGESDGEPRAGEDRAAVAVERAAGELACDQIRERRSRIRPVCRPARARATSCAAAPWCRARRARARKARCLPSR